MATFLRVLIVDESQDDAERIVLALKRAGYRLIWKRVDTAGTLTAALSEAAWVWDAITCDCVMLKFHCLSALHIIRALAPRTPVILLSDERDEPQVVDLLGEGVCGFLSKRRLDDLPQTVGRAVRPR